MKQLSAALLCVALPCVALADEPRYTYVQGGYQYLDIDDLDIDGDGWFVGGSFGITERLHLLADYSDLGLDFGFDVSTLRLGIGGHLPLDQGVHLVGEAGYVRAKVDHRFGDFTDDGLFVSGGVRWMATDRVELNALLNYVDLDDSGNDTSVSGGILYNLTPELALGANVTLGDDSTGYTVGLRYYFPGL